MNSFAVSRPDILVPRKSSDQVVRMAQLVRLLRRHLWAIGLCAAVGGVGAFVYAHTLPKTYTANGLMTVEGDRIALPELQGVLRGDDGPDPMPFVHTEVQALTSRALDTQVVHQLHLETLPEFNADLRPPTLMQKVGHFFGGLIGPLLPRTAPAPAGPASDDGVIGTAQKALSVFQDNRSLVISISFVSRDPQLAARFVNTLIETYVNSRAQHRADANQGAGTVLAQRIDQARADLAAIETKMRDLRNTGDVVGVRAGSIGQQQVEELTTAAASAALEHSQIEVNYARAVAAEKQGSSDALATVLNSPTISRLRDEEAQASSQIAQLSAHYGPMHPQMRIAVAQERAARRQLSDEVGRIVASLGAQLKVAAEQDAFVHQQLEQARHVAVRAENARAQLDQLQQEEVTRRALYSTLLERSQQTMAQPVADSTPDVRVLSPAVPPAFPSGPHTVLVGLLGGCGGLLLGCLAALTRLRSVSGFESAEEVTEATGLPVLASLPRSLLRRGGSAPVDEPDAGRRQALAIADAEAMRVVRHRLRFSGWSSVPRCALFLSDGARPGSHLAVRLATGFARTAAADGERVLLIDADLSAPLLARHLGLSAAEPSARHVGRSLGRGGNQASLVLAPAHGMAAALSGTDWREAIVPDQQAGLDLLLVERRMHNAHALIGSVTFQNLLVECTADYDLVVLHGPSAGTADAESLMQRVDAAIMVIDARGDRLAAQAAAQQFRAIARTPMFAVLVQRT